MKKTIARNFLSLTLAELITRLLGFALTVLVARFLGANGLGQFSFAMAFIAYFTFFTDFGLTMIGTREIASNQNETSKIGTTILLIQMILAIVLGIAAFGSAFLLPIDSKTKSLIIILSFGLIPFALNLNYIFNATQKMGFTALVKAVIQITYFIFSLSLIVIYKDILYAGLGNVVGNLVGAVISIVLAVKIFHFRLDKIDWSFTKKLAIQALPLGISALLVQVFYNFDTVAIGLSKSVFEVGIYSAAYKFLLVISSFGFFYFGALFPIFSEKYKNQEYKEIEKIGNSSLKLLFFGTFPIVAGIIATAPNFLPKFLGAEFHPSVLILQILVLNIVFLWLNNFLGSLLIADGEQKFELVGVAAGSIANIVLNLILIPRYGILAAAIVSILSQLITFGFAYYFVNKKTHLNMISTSFKSLLNSIIMLVVLVVIFSRLKPNVYSLLLEILSGFVIYTLLSLITSNIPEQFGLLKKLRAKESV